MPKGPLRVVRTPTIPENLSELGHIWVWWFDAKVPLLSTL